MKINFSLDVDDCEPNPCKHGGSCYDGIDRHSCVCVLGYAGYNCEIGSQWFILIIFYSKLFVSHGIPTLKFVFISFLECELNSDCKTHFCSNFTCSGNFVYFLFIQFSLII